jgi:hypothetical protein
MSEEISNDYFTSYDSISVHNLMLRDESRVTKYRDAILGSKNLFKDKVILELLVMNILFYDLYKY